MNGECYPLDGTLGEVLPTELEDHYSWVQLVARQADGTLIQTATLPDGARHQTHLSLARFYRHIKMHPEGIWERLETLDRRNPIRDPDYIERVIKWGCDHPGFPGCDDESLRRYCQPESCFYARLKNHGK